MGRPRRWTDDQLVAAVAASTTMAEVLRRLGLPKGGASLDTVRRRVLELGLDAPHLLRAAHSPKWAADPGDRAVQAPLACRWSDDEIALAVLGATSMRDVMVRLGAPPSGGAWTTVKARIVVLGLDTSHFNGRRGVRRRPRRNAASRRTHAKKERRSWTDADLEAAVAASTSIAGVIRALGLCVGGSVYVDIPAAIARLGLSTAHFTGRGWRKGRRGPWKPPRPLSEILVAGSDYGCTAKLRERLIEEGLKERRCEMCGLTQWAERPAPLQLDHINGDRTDHRIDNLRILCANCHAQTDTWCSRNRGRINRLGSLVETADTHPSKGCAFGHEGSSPSGPTPPLQLSLGGLAQLD